MRAVVQRVSEASVTVDGQVVAAIKQGLLVFVGIARGDHPGRVKHLAKKIVELRVFADRGGRFDIRRRRNTKARQGLSQHSVLGRVGRQALA